MEHAQYSFVTVAYPGEIGFMHLQARSIAMHVPSHLVQEIIVIENTPPAFPEKWRDKLRDEYGVHRDTMRFLAANAIADIPKHCGGWFSQQVLKLMVANHLKAPRYLLLDAKNHFVFPLSRSHLEKDGKPRTYTLDYLNHPLLRYLDPILDYFRLPREHNAHFLPTVTPFVVDSTLIREMIVTMKTKERRPFEDIFLQSAVRFTEFFMIGAYILSKKKQFEDYFDLSGCGNVTIWPRDASHEEIVRRKIMHSESQRTPVFAVHRAAFSLLNEGGRQALATFWLQRNLFSNQPAAFRFAADPNTGWADPN